MDGVCPEARQLNEELRRLCGALLDAVNTLHELQRPAVVPCTEFASRRCIEGIALPRSLGSLVYRRRGEVDTPGVVLVAELLRQVCVCRMDGHARALQLGHRFNPRGCVNLRFG